VGLLAVLSSKPVLVVVRYIGNSAAAEFAADSSTCGAETNALLKVTTASFPEVVHCEPVVIVMTPVVSVPDMVMVGTVHAAGAATIPGTPPPVTICPFTVNTPLT